MTPENALLVSQVLFWIVAAGVAFLPIRWALFCFILASHMDITTVTFASASTVGFENTVRIICLPALLLWRTGFSFRDLAWTLPQKLWLALVVYAAISGFWSGFLLSAMKMVVYLSVYLALFAIFCSAWANRWIDIGMMRLVAWCAIALAVLQTFVLGNAFGGIEDRFTSFSSPQYFAASLVALLAILVFSRERGLFHYTTCGLLVLAIVLSGSRYVFASAVIMLMIASFQVASGGDDSLQWKPNFRKIFVTLGLVAAAVAALFSYVPSLRFEELFNVVNDDDGAVQDVGTLAWRIGIYQDIFTQLEKRTGPQLFFGSGTSSGAALMLDRDPDKYDKEVIDGNRALHSEYLRALYEWGILGLSLLCSFLVATIVGFARKMGSEGGGPALAFLGVFPSIVIGLAIENVLAGAASAAGVGVLLAMTFAWQVEPSWLSESVAGDGLGSESPMISA
jgi:O-antigen ligase/polysaccharide polymerase Wzy-like membrane protein